MMAKGLTERIHEVLAHALRCPGYKRKYNGLDVSAKKFTELPFLTSRELAERPFDFLSVPYNEVSYIFCSSGTTGRPKIIMLSEEDFEREATYCARFSRLEGVKSCDRVAVLFPMRMWSVGHVVMRAHAKLGASVFPMDTYGSMETKRELLRLVSPTILSSMPSTLLSLGKSSMDLRGTVRIIETTGEALSKATRDRLEDMFGGEVYDAYGLSEGAVGVECACHDGFHYWEDSVILEVIDLETGEPLDEGEIGEIVMTNLLRKTMPIVRYRTGDLGFISREECECGLRTPRVWIVGRKEKTIFLPDGVKVLASQISELLSSIEGLTTSFRLTISQEDDIVALSFEVEVEEGAELRPEDIADKIRYSISPDLTDLVENNRVFVDVKLVSKDVIPRGISGKPAQIIIDLRHR